MKEYILDDFIKGKVVINCKTEEEAKNFVVFLLLNNLEWYEDFHDSDGSYIKFPFWGVFKENTCYICKGEKFVDFCDIKYYEDEQVKILPLSHITKGNRVGVVKSITNNYLNCIKEILKIFSTKEEAEIYVNELIKNRDLEIEKELAGKTEEEVEVWWEENEWYDIYNIIPIKD